MEGIIVSKLKDYDEMSDFEKLRFVEEYNQELKKVISKKIAVIAEFNSRYATIRSQLKKKFPGWSKLITYKEELKASRITNRENKKLLAATEVQRVTLLMEVAKYKAQVEELTEKLAKVTQ